MSASSDKPLICITCGKEYVAGDSIYTIATDEEKGEFQHWKCRQSPEDFKAELDSMLIKANHTLDKVRRLLRK